MPIAVIFVAVVVINGSIQSACADPVTADQTALELGRKVLAVKQAIQNPGGPDAIKAITDLGRDQRFYVMVRGWLSYQLEGDMSIFYAAKEQTPDAVMERIDFLNDAIRAIDLE
jgi:ABC-type dipeptide/oligopeptide/nickel transport system permease component